MLPALFSTFKNYICMISHKNHHIFTTLIKSSWSELSNGTLVDTWVQKLTPNQPISHCDPAIASSISFFLCPSQKFTVPSANLARRWNHTINLFMVWTLCSYGFSTGCGWLMALCHDNITPCPIDAKKVGLVGFFFTASNHLLAPPWKKASSACTILI